MNADERRNGLIEKANSLIDKIQDAMRLVENAERAKEKFMRPDSVLSLELPTEGDDEFKDVFKLEEIFDEKGTEKIKAYILTELELLEESNLKLLEAAGFVEHRQDNAPQTDAADVQDTADTEPAEAAGSEIPFTDPEEDDSDMKIVIPNKIEKGHHSRTPLEADKVEQIKKLSKEGMKPAEIARQTGVSYKSAAKYMETVPNGETKSSGRSVSKR